MSKQICQNCGGEIANDFNQTLSFCTNCGSGINLLQNEKTLLSPEKTSTFSPTPVNYNAKPNGKSPNYLLGCFGLLIGGVFLSAFGVFGYWWWSSSTEKTFVNSEYYGVIVPPKSQVVRFMNGSTRESKSLDPQAGDLDEIKIANALFDGLAEYNNQNSDLKPSLAIKWEKNADSTVWTFYLRQDAKWTDGNPITAHDFVYSWTRSVNPNLKLNAFMFFYIKNAKSVNEKTAPPDAFGVKAIDDYTLQVTMEKPTPFFDKVAAMPYFRPIPRQAVEKFGKDWTKPENIVSSGAFKLAEWTPKDKIVLERNAQFWDNANTKLEKIVFPSPERVSLDKLRVVEWYKNGEIDVSLSTVSDDESFVDKKDFLRVKTSGTRFLWLNTTVKPFNDNRVRRALSLAINREAFKELKITNFPTYSFLPEIKGYENSKSGGYNPDEARKLLTEAGFSNGNNFPEFEIIFNTSKTNFDIAENIQRQWQKELGIKVKSVNIEFKDFLKKRSALDYKGAAIGGWSSDFDDPYNFLAFFSDEKNGTGWSDKKFIEMLEKTNTEPDEAKRYRMLTEVENYLLEQQPVVPLYVSRNSFLCKPFVKNLAPNPLGYINWREVYIDQNAVGK